jgi:hypothetical protein
VREIHQQVKAKADLIAIWQYSYKEHGEQQSDKYYDENNNLDRHS